MSWAYILLNTEPGQMENVLEKIKQINGVGEAHMVYGNYDILIKVKSRNPKELKTIVQNIRIQENVHSLITLMVINE